MKDHRKTTRTTYPIPPGWFEKHFPKCINCGKQVMYIGGVPHPEVAICSDCAEQELKRRRNTDS